MSNVACPQCGTRSAWSLHNPYRPFCSERCKMIDLGAWANGDYAIPLENPPEIDEQDLLN
jgi:endogenous inhibitor of DNA gyrase (YacG/DUF329 family)